MVEYKMQPDRTALLIIDMTNGFLMPGSPLEIPGGRDLIPGLSRLAGVCREKDITVIFVSHVFRKDGSDMGLSAVFRPPEAAAKGTLSEGTASVEFYKGIQPGKNDIVLKKQRFSAFVGTALDLILRSNEIDTLIIGGVATNICCESTARDARMRDYKVIFLSDGTAPIRPPDMGWGIFSLNDIQRLVLTTMAFQYAQVLSIDGVISRLNSLKKQGCR